VGSAYCRRCNVLNQADDAPAGHTLLCAGGCGTTLTLEADAPSQLYPSFTCPQCSTQLAVIGNEHTVCCGSCGNTIRVPERLLNLRLSQHTTPVGQSSRETNNGSGCLSVLLVILIPTLLLAVTLLGTQIACSTKTHNKNMHRNAVGAAICKSHQLVRVR